MEETLKNPKSSDSGVGNEGSEDQDAEKTQGNHGLADAEAKKPSSFKKWTAKLAITPPLLITMFKGALPPTIGIAM